MQRNIARERENVTMRRKKNSRRRASRHHNGQWDPITVDEACEIGRFSRRHFFRIKSLLETRKLGRKVLINRSSVLHYIESLPAC